jgi:hypothetical protein
MLTATIKTKSAGKGVDENDLSLVRFEIIAHVRGHEVSAVVSFERAWLDKCLIGTNAAGISWCKPERRGLGVTVRSNGWTYVGIGIDKMREALEGFGVEVEN